MNSQQISNILQQDRYVSPIFHGVYPINRIPPIQDGAYVINTAPHDHPGLHWVAVIVNGKSAEYFDSYGGDPIGVVQRWGKQKRWSNNPIPLQSPLTSVCGQYCIYYLLHRTRGIDLNTLLMDFGADVDRNDKVVYDFVENHFDLQNLTLIDTKNVIYQLCQARLTDPSIRKMVWTE